MSELTPNQPFGKPVFQHFHYFVLGCAGLIYFLITLGDFAFRTGIGLDLSQWLFAPSVVMVAIAGVFAWRSYRSQRWISRPIFISVLVIGMQVVLAFQRLSPGASSGVITAYATSALLVHALVLTSTVVAFRLAGEKRTSISFESPFARLSLLVVGMTFLTLVTGAVETSSGAASVCQGWLRCGETWIPENSLEWIHVIHRLSVGLNGVLMLTLFIRAWQTQRFHTPILVLSTSGFFLFLSQGLVGAWISTQNNSIEFVGLHSATATALWAVLTVLAIQAGMSTPVTTPDVYSYTDWREKAKDFLVLTKPIIVLLLLVTTLGGMIVGAGALPSFPIIFWTLVGGGLAAGGSGAINQYIDRDLDTLMRRTAKRPLAARRLTPAEGLAFGVGLCLLAFYLLAVFTNLLAAMLSVIGMFYYVWVYSILLKRTTVQNIVIGGGAGAIPPLVGWAAATGSLSVAAGLLFLIIFFWTPPHFWALALLRSKEYESGGIPMMPVVRGERETRKQMLIYSIELVILTLIAPLVGIGSGIYFFSAAALGLILLAMVWKLWKHGYSPKLSYRIYRYTSMYLAFIFLAMVVDALV
ncbi:MAG: protoheme IX farnesyltransferase [Anaerolineae bacterium]|nr:protoheme IX farnesyltransferase [Anaerolineae bacterium]